jgi:hypothetical protein
VTKIVIFVPFFAGEGEKVTIFKAWQGVYYGMPFATLEDNYERKGVEYTNKALIRGYMGYHPIRNGFI